MDTRHKRMFVNQYYLNNEHRAKQAVQVFEWIKPFESQWGIDFTEQKLPELTNAVNRILGENDLRNDLTTDIMIRYTEWRKKRVRETGDAIYDVVLDEINAARREMVCSEVELSDVINAAFESAKSCTSDCIYRVYLWMAFMGVPELRAVEVSASDISEDYSELRAGEKIYRIPTAAREDFMYASSLTSFSETKIRDGVVVFRSMKRSEGNEIMRGAASKRTRPIKDTLKTTIRPTLDRKMKTAYHKNAESNNPMNIGFRLTYDRVYMSGIYIRAYEKECDGIVPDFYEEAEFELKRNMDRGKVYIPTPGNPISKVKSRIRRDLLAGYKKWRETFVIPYSYKEQ